MHNFNVCPAAEVTCFHCKKKGLYARKCKSHNVHEVEVEEVEEMYDHFLYRDHRSQQKGKGVPLSVEGKKILFKLDTGSEVNILPFHMYESHCSKKKLVPTPNLLGTSATVVSLTVNSFCTLNTNVSFTPIEFMVVDSKKPHYWSVNVRRSQPSKVCQRDQTVRRVFVERDLTKNKV